MYYQIYGHMFNYPTTFRFSLSPSYSQLQKGLKDDIKSKLAKVNARTDSKVVIIKLFLTSLEYQRIQNFPQHGLQLVAEVGAQFINSIFIIKVVYIYIYIYILK